MSVGSFSNCVSQFRVDSDVTKAGGASDVWRVRMTSEDAKKMRVESKGTAL